MRKVETFGRLGRSTALGIGTNYLDEKHQENFRLGLEFAGELLQE